MIPNFGDNSNEGFEFFVPFSDNNREEYLLEFDSFIPRVDFWKILSINFSEFCIHVRIGYDSIVLRANTSYKRIHQACFIRKCINCQSQYFGNECFSLRKGRKSRKFTTQAPTDRHKITETPDDISFNDSLTAFSGIFDSSYNSKSPFTFSRSIKQKTRQKTPKTTAFLPQSYAVTVTQESPLLRD